VQHQLTQHLPSHPANLPSHPANQLLPYQPANLPSHPANLLTLTISLLPRNRGTKVCI
jgi:hypothetical protein